MCCKQMISLVFSFDVLFLKMKEMTCVLESTNPNLTLKSNFTNFQRSFYGSTLESTRT